MTSVAVVTEGECLRLEQEAQRRLKWRGAPDEMAEAFRKSGVRLTEESVDKLLTSQGVYCEDIAREAVALFTLVLQWVNSGGCARLTLLQSGNRVAVGIEAKYFRYLRLLGLVDLVDST